MSGALREKQLFVNGDGDLVSEWILAIDLSDISIHVVGPTAAYQIWGSNDDGINSSVTNEVQLGSDITAAGIVKVDQSPKWIRMKRTNDVGSARLVGKVSVT